MQKCLIIFYGTTRTPVIDKLNKGNNVLFDIDWQGADQIKNKKLDYKLITFFYFTSKQRSFYLKDCRIEI